TKTFTAVGYVGSTPVSITPVWSKTSGVGSIHADTGVFTAGSTAGSAVLRATVGLITAEVTVTVSAAGLASITITGNAAANNGERVQTFTVSGADSLGNPVALDG